MTPFLSPNLLFGSTGRGTKGATERRLPKHFNPLLPSSIIQMIERRQTGDKTPEHGGVNVTSPDERRKWTIDILARGPSR